MDFKKNPKLVYLLLVLVIIIWATIFIKIFTYPDAENPYNIPKTVKAKTPKTEKEKEDYVLLLDYEDPFLGKSTSGMNLCSYSRGESVQTSQDSPREIITKVSSEKPESSEFVVPKITYQGMFNNTSQNKKVAILKVDNKRFILGEGETAADIQILSVQQDSIILSFKKEELVYKKNK